MKTRMKKLMKSLVQAMLRPVGLKAVGIHKDEILAMPPDFGKEEIEIIRDVLPYTMSSSERVYTMIQAVKYVVSSRIPREIVECGVWKGGNIMAAAKTLLKLGYCDKHLYLFDTFEGMTDPEQVDVAFGGESASRVQADHKLPGDQGSNWCRAELEEVQGPMLGLGYDSAKIHFVKGRVQDTIPRDAPYTISLLRLETN